MTESIQGIEGLNSWKIKLLSLKDMINSLLVRITIPKVKKGQWIRIKKGEYKDDLGEAKNYFNKK